MKWSVGDKWKNHEALLESTNQICVSEVRLDAEAAAQKAGARRVPRESTGCHIGHTRDHLESAIPLPLDFLKIL